jgi:hypothetical protein
VTHRKEILSEIVAQCDEHLGTASDGTEPPRDWLKLIDSQQRLAMASVGDDYRTRLIEIALLAVSAIDAFDRQNGYEDS